jgi:hypothetical protein
MKDDKHQTRIAIIRESYGKSFRQRGGKTNDIIMIEGKPLSQALERAAAAPPRLSLSSILLSFFL